MEYMRDDASDLYGLKELQNKILEIATYIDKLCRENNIDYCLMGGSALGAKRHGGFIPWDDDLDVFMRAEEYAKFREAFQTGGDHDLYYLQEWGAVDGMITMAKIRMNGTTYIEESLKDWDIHHGIYVDIFVLQVCPKHRIQQLHQCFWAKYVLLKGLSIRKYNRKKGIKGLAVKVVGLLPDKFLVKHGLRQVYKYNGKDTGLFCYFFGRAIFKNAIYEKKWFVPTEYVSFEKTELRVPVGLHDFLQTRFGDYMKIPDEKTIKAMQHAEQWDVNVDFHKALGRESMSYIDEKRLLG